MREQRIQLQSLTLGNSLSLTQYLKDVMKKEPKSILFDFNKMDKVTPFGMLYVASEIKKIRDDHKSIKFIAEGFKDKSYAQHMGFFRAFGLESGKHPGEASGSDTYIPIRIFDTIKLREQAMNKKISIGDFIEHTSNKISAVLAREEKGDLAETLTYSIREIMRNVLEHSKSKKFAFCAQYWPSKNTVEVSLLDNGIGIKEGLSENPHLQLESDLEAIKLSLMPGISGKAYLGSFLDPNDEWANSGFGLYMTNRICSNGGNFTIISGKHGYTNSETGSSFSANFQGTAIRLIINTSNLDSLRKKLAIYRKEARKIKSEFSNNMDASTASMMLSKDFKTR